jgi:hypothetical protein
MFTSVSDSAVRDGDRLLRCEMASMATMRMRHAAMQSRRQLSHWSAIRREKYALQQAHPANHLQPDSEWQCINQGAHSAHGTMRRGCHC